MKLLNRIANLFRNVFLKTEVEEELDEEVRSLLDQMVEEKVALGVSPHEARREAQIELGGSEQLKERVREVRMGKLIQDFWLDMRYGVRMLRKSPGFTAVAVITLALGIGANTAIFSVVNGVLLRPLPYHDPGQLAYIRIDVEGNNGMESLSPPEVIDLRERSTMFSEFGGVWPSTDSLTDNDNPEYIQIAWATDNLFSMLGLNPILGRSFLPEEEKSGGPGVIILSYELWQNRYGGDPNIVGKPVRMQGGAREVVGVLPEGFRLFMGSDTNVTPQIDAWTPQVWWENRDLRWLRVIGRLKPGVTFAQAQGELDSISAQLGSEHGNYASTGLQFHAIPLRWDVVRHVQPAVVALMGAVGFVLLIACANIASLLLARTKRREKEMAIRKAMGASRTRLLRQVLAENLTLAMLGGTLGVLLAWWGVDALLALQLTELPRAENIRLDATVLSVAVLTSLLTTLLVGWMPAWRGSKPNLDVSLKEGGRSPHGTRRSRLHSVLVVGQVALSMVLLVGAGLMVRTFRHLQRVDLGFDPDNVVTIRVPVDGRRFQTAGDQWRFYLDLRQRLEALPAVESAGGVSIRPFSSEMWLSTTKYAYDAASEDTIRSRTATFRAILPGYFKTMKTSFLEGRDFTRQGADTRYPVAIVDELLARRSWPGENPIGKKIKIDWVAGQRAATWVEVVGVVQHIRTDSLREEGLPQVYVPYWFLTDKMNLVIRATSDPVSLVPAVREAVKELGSGRPIHSVRSLESFVSSAIGDTRFALYLLIFLAGIGLLLSVVGVYGVVAYSVSQRTHEFGVRRALGAQSKDILMDVLKYGLTLALVGVGIGLGGAYFITQSLSHLLFGVSATDGLTFFGIAGLLVMAAVLACYLPARRAMKVDPMTALRYE